MGARGPARKATSSKLPRDPGKRANTRAKKEQAAATIGGAVDVTVLQKPDYLVPEAIEHWDFLVPKLVAANVVCVLDTDLLARYCQCQGKSIKYERYCEKYGDFVKKGQSAIKVPRPELKLIADLRKEADKLADKLGLTPKCRAALGVKIARTISDSERQENAEFAAIVNSRRR